MRKVMTEDVKYCFNRDKRLVGIVSPGDVALTEGRAAAGDAIVGVSRPGGPHSQAAHA